MTAERLPKSYEDLVANEILRHFLEEQGLLREESQTAVMEDEAGNPILYRKGEIPQTPEEWEEGTPIQHLLGENKTETEILLDAFSWRPYQF
jgi:hypothetical protein